RSDSFQVLPSWSLASKLGALSPALGVSARSNAGRNRANASTIIRIVRVFIIVFSNVVIDELLGVKLPNRSGLSNREPPAWTVPKRVFKKGAGTASSPLFFSI